VAYVVISSRCLIGFVFAVSAFAKLRRRSSFREFRDWLARLPVPVARTWPGLAAAVLALAEVAVVLLVALPWTGRAGLVFAAAVLALFTAGTLLALRARAQVTCQCFGTSRSPMGRRHVVRNLLLCAVAITGDAYAGGHGVRPAGVLIALVAGAVAALFVVFLDDLAALLADDARAGAASAAGRR
jgi:hypothetical protein